MSALKTSLKTDLQNAARQHGFDMCRITHPDAAPNAAEGLARFLAAGHHGDMEWLARHSERRSHPKNLWGDVQSIIVLGVNYSPEANLGATLLADKRESDKGMVSLYAQRRDYHDVMKKNARALAVWFAKTSGADVKFFVDTAPILEKPLAAAAGIGWQGKHTNLVSRDFGSWLFLGSIFTTHALGQDFSPDEEEPDQCGSCRACLDVCPTQAFPAPYQLDARRCISYLTIEHKGVIDQSLRAAMGNYIYGCDDCLAVCPWNKFAKVGQEVRLALRPELHLPDLVMLAALDDAAFRTMFAGTPIKRVGRDRFLRNVMIALGNAKEQSEKQSGEQSEKQRDKQKDAVRGRLHDASALVRGMAVWAYGRLDADGARADAPRYMADEQDADVLAEWRLVQ